MVVPREQSQTIEDLPVAVVTADTAGRGDPAKEVETLTGAGVLVFRFDAQEGVKFLLSERRSPMKKDRRTPIEAGRLAEPGGSLLNPGETPKECAERELREETGMELPESSKLIQIYDYTFAFNNGLTSHYSGFILLWTGEIGPILDREPDKRESWRWVTNSEIESARSQGKLAASTAALIDAFNNLHIETPEEYSRVCAGGVEISHGHIDLPR